MNSKIIFGLNNRVDLATVTSDGTFETTLPLANVKNYLLSQAARTTTDAAFTITIDLSSLAARAIGCVAIAGHNLSRTATVQVQTYQGAGLVDDSGDTSPWPFLAENDPHWDVHTYAAAIVDTERMTDMAATMIYFLPTNLEANKVILTITDTSNPDTYVEIGRLFVGQQLKPAINIEWGGVSWGHVDFSEIQVTRNRIKYAYEHPVIRTASVQFKNLTGGEAIGGAWTAQRIAGLTGEIIVAPDIPDYTDISGTLAVDTNWFQRAFMGNYSALDPLTNPYIDFNAIGFTVDEVI